MHHDAGAGDAYRRREMDRSFRLRRRTDEKEQPTWPPLLRAHPLELGCLVGVGFALGFGAVATVVVLILVGIFGAGLHASLPFLPTPTP